MSSGHAAVDPLGFIENLSSLDDLFGAEEFGNTNEHEIRTIPLKFAKNPTLTPTLSQRARWSLLPLGEG